MNNIQTGIASLLAIAFLAALPGVYFYTEGPAPEQSSQSNTATAGTSSSSQSNSANLAEFDPVPVPSESELPETSFELSELTEGEKREVARKMMIDVNTAPKSQLQRISGVGPATAERIINFREENNGIDSIDQMDQISGFGPATLDKLRDQVKVSGRLPEGADVSLGSEESDESEGESDEPSSSGPTVNVNTASSSELQKLDGIGPATAEKIIKFREENGPITSVEQMDKISGIGSATVEDMRGNVTF